MPHAPRVPPARCIGRGCRLHDSVRQRAPRGPGPLRSAKRCGLWKGQPKGTCVTPDVSVAMTTEDGRRREARRGALRSKESQPRTATPRSHSCAMGKRTETNHRTWAVRSRHTREPIPGQPCESRQGSLGCGAVLCVALCWPGSLGVAASRRVPSPPVCLSRWVIWRAVRAQLKQGNVCGRGKAEMPAGSAGQRRSRPWHTPLHREMAVHAACPIVQALVSRERPSIRIALTYMCE